MKSYLSSMNKLLYFSFVSNKIKTHDLYNKLPKNNFEIHTKQIYMKRFQQSISSAELFKKKKQSN